MARDGRDARRGYAVNARTAHLARRARRAALIAPVAGAVLLSGAIGLAPAPPAPSDDTAASQPARAERHQPDRQAEPGRAELRAALTRQLARIDELESRLRDAVDAIDGGADLDEIREALPDREQIAEMFARPRPGLAAGRDRGDRFRDRFDDDDEPSDEQIERVRAFIAEHIPPLDRRLNEAAERSPRAERRLLRWIAPRMMDTVRLAERDPEAAKIRVREMLASLEVVDAMRKAAREEGDGLSEARAELVDALRAQHEARLAFERREVERAFERAREKERSLERKKSDIEQRIQREADRLIERARSWGRRGDDDRDASRR